MLGKNALWSDRLYSRLIRKVLVKMGRSQEDFHRHAFKKGLKKSKADVVLAEFGYSGALIWRVCRDLDRPLVVHFHGTDINRRELFEKYQSEYQKMFQYASHLIVVSNNEKRKLVDIGADPDQISVIPCGGDLPDKDYSFDYSKENYNIVSITRMSEVKAPQLTILAFYKYLSIGGKGKLHMIGNGPLLVICKSIVQGLKISEKVIFHGRINHNEVLNILKSSQMYVQHSVVAEDGDCEGMPVSLMEAAGYGLPIVTTAPGGIAEYFEHGTNCFIVQQYDVDAMAQYMYDVWNDRNKADKIGKAAFELAKQKFDAKKQASKVKEICVNACK